ncbi:MAG: hypothetical protein GY860_14890 [Desulfobacteraceae bacterium]|nr:hypothetical protein [Desulfobacteraceae bacterium]
MATKLGIYSILIGLFVGIFTGISKFMKSDNFWVDLTISKFTKDYSDRIVEFISVDFIQDGLYFIVYELPFSGAVLGLGVLLLIIGAMVKQH